MADGDGVISIFLCGLSYNWTRQHGESRGPAPSNPKSEQAREQASPVPSALIAQ